MDDFTRSIARQRAASIEQGFFRSHPSQRRRAAVLRARIEAAERAEVGAAEAADRIELPPSAWERRGEDPTMVGLATLTVAFPGWLVGARAMRDAEATGHVPIRQWGISATVAGLAAIAGTWVVLSVAPGLDMGAVRGILAWLMVQAAAAMIARAVLAWLWAWGAVEERTSASERRGDERGAHSAMYDPAVRVEFLKRHYRPYEWPGVRRNIARSRAWRVRLGVRSPRLVEPEPAPPEGGPWRLPS